MSKRTTRWDKLVPAEMDGRREVRRLAIGLAASLVWNAVAFPVRYASIWRGRWNRMEFPCFDELLGPSLLPFALMAGWMLALALVYFLGHYQGSRSIYLMRRLPDRGELWRRCLSLPLAGLCAVLVLAFGLSAAYFYVYQTFTPPAQLPRQALQGMWYGMFYHMFY